MKVIQFPYNNAIDIDERVLDIRERRHGTTKKEEDHPPKTEKTLKTWQGNGIKSEGLIKCKSENQGKLLL